MKFIWENIATKRAISPQLVSSSTSVNGSILDRFGFYGIVITGITGAKTGTFNSCVFKLQHGDAPNGSDMADVAGATVTVTDEDSFGEINVDATGLKKYVRVVATVSVGSSSSILIGATITLGNPSKLPV